MKSLIFLLLFAVNSLSSADRFHLYGTIKGIDNQIVYLTNWESVVLDSFVCKGGKFEFSGNIIEPGMYIVRVKDTPGRLQVFLENGEVELTANFNESEKRYRDIIVKGSSEHDLLKRMNNAESGGLTSAEMAQMMEWQRNNDTLSIQKLKQIKMEETEKSFKIIIEIVRQYPSNYAPAFWIGSARIDGLAPSIIENFFTIYSLLDSKIKQSYYAKKFLANYEKEKRK